MARRQGDSPVDQSGPPPYASPVREQQARRTRRAIVHAARELFLEKGYAATTIDEIAHRAGVGRKTVFSSTGGKGTLLKLAWDWTLAGDDEPVPMAERPAVRAMLAEGDPRRLVRMWVDLQVDVGVRAAPLGAVVVVASDVDTDVRALHETIRQESLAGATAFVTHLVDIGGLRADLGIEQAAEVCWALLNSALLHLLMNGRGWSPHAYAAWLLDVVSTSLLEPDLAHSPPPAVEVHREPSSYVALVDGRVAGRLRLEQAERVVVLTRTDARPGADGLDVADTLVRAAFDEARAGGLPILPVCPYVVWWVGQHPEEQAHVYDDGASA